MGKISFPKFPLGRLLLLFIILLVLFYFGRKTLIFFHSLIEEKNLKKQSLILMAENEVIKMRIEEYKKGTTIEARARDELGMIKEGEKVYIIKR